MKKLILCVAAMFVFSFCIGQSLGKASASAKSSTVEAVSTTASKTTGEDVVIVFHSRRKEKSAKPGFKPFKIKMKVTAYDPWDKECVGKWAKLNKKDPRRRKKWSKPGLAAAHNLLPLGTRLRTKEFGKLKVDDTGGAMRESAESCVYHLDSRLQKHEAADKWGVQWIEVEVLDPIPNSPCLEKALALAATQK
ncbi:MAG: hypothetical protein AAB897_02895 [Patescibacteria group bacterium]